MILRRIRSFARRDSRMTFAQAQAWDKWLPKLGLDSRAGALNISKTFGREAPCFLEIGFGSGHSLAALAQQQPEIDFIGIETFKPGIGALFLQIEALQLKNIRVYYADAVEVLENCIPDQSLQGLQIFFPDPWPKRRHHKRRLIQAPFVQLVTRKLQPNAVMHLATDWQDYAKEMLRILMAESALHNLAADGHYAQRSPLRPRVTKFEGRGEKDGRAIWELQFAKK